MQPKMTSCEVKWLPTCQDTRTFCKIAVFVQSACVNVRIDLFQGLCIECQLSYIYICKYIEAKCNTVLFCFYIELQLPNKFF